MPAVVAPVLAIVGAAAGAIGTVAAGIGAVAGAIGISGATLFSAAATVALVGVEYLLRPSAGGQPQLQPPQAGPRPAPLAKTIRQSDTPRCFIFGRTLTAGAYFWYDADGWFNAAGNRGNNLYQGIYLCDGPVDGWDAFICDNEAAPVERSTDNPSITDGSDDVNIYGFSSGMKSITVGGSNTLQGYYVSCFAPANATEAGYYTPLTTRFSDNPLMTSVWPTTCVGKGVTCVYTWSSGFFLTQTSGSNTRPKRFPTGFPEWQFALRGARVYDPRDTSQTELENGVWTLYNTTWKWTENPALIAGHFIRWLISENLTAIQGVDWTSIATAANDCDAIVAATHRAVSSGAPGAASEKFARLTGVYYFTTPPREFLSQIMAACDGFYGTDQNGKFVMWIGKWENPAVTFDESDVTAFTEEFVAPVSESVNEIHSTYMEPANNYQRYEAPVWRDEASVSLIGRRVASLNYDLVPSSNQAYRMSQRYARRINGKRKLQITLGPRGMLAFKQRVVGLSLPSFGIEQSTWRVEHLEPQGNLTSWTATLREITSSVFADDAPPRDPASVLTVITNYSAPTLASWETAVYESTSTTGYCVASLNQHKNTSGAAAAGVITSGVVQEQTLVFQGGYSTDGGGTITPMTIYLSNYITRSPDLAKGTSVQIYIRFMYPDGTFTSWTGFYTVTI